MSLRDEAFAALQAYHAASTRAAADPTDENQHEADRLHRIWWGLAAAADEDDEKKRTRTSSSAKPSSPPSLRGLPSSLPPFRAGQRTGPFRKASGPSHKPPLKDTSANTKATQPTPKNTAGTGWEGISKASEVWHEAPQHADQDDADRQGQDLPPPHQGTLDALRRQRISNIFSSHTPHKPSEDESIFLWHFPSVHNPDQPQSVDEFYASFRQWQEGLSDLQKSEIRANWRDHQARHGLAPEPAQPASHEDEIFAEDTQFPEPPEPPQPLAPEPELDPLPAMQPDPGWQPADLPQPDLPSLDPFPTLEPPAPEPIEPLLPSPLDNLGFDSTSPIGGGPPEQSDDPKGGPPPPASAG